MGWGSRLWDAATCRHPGSQAAHDAPTASSHRLKVIQVGSLPKGTYNSSTGFRRVDVSHGVCVWKPCVTRQSTVSSWTLWVHGGLASSNQTAADGFLCYRAPNLLSIKYDMTAEVNIVPGGDYGLMGCKWYAQVIWPFGEPILQSALEYGHWGPWPGNWSMLAGVHSPGSVQLFWQGRRIAELNTSLLDPPEFDLPVSGNCNAQRESVPVLNESHSLAASLPVLRAGARRSIYGLFADEWRRAQPFCGRTAVSRWSRCTYQNNKKAREDGAQRRMEL